ncbi:MAG: hypothetical protein QOH66_1779 [Actinomycetota bacterium]|nr:hypothetical protein [Actinomycetota bacterium]
MLERPRRAVIMVQAGDAIDSVFDAMAAALEPDDVPSTTATPTPGTLAGAKRRCAAGESTSSGTGNSGGGGALLGLKTFAQISDRRAASGKTAHRSDSAEAHRISPAQREVFRHTGTCACLVEDPGNGRSRRRRRRARFSGDGRRHLGAKRPIDGCWSINPSRSAPRASEGVSLRSGRGCPAGMGAERCAGPELSALRGHPEIAGGQIGWCWST